MFIFAFSKSTILLFAKTLNNEPEFVEPFGLLIEDLDDEKEFIPRFYYPIFLMRRLTYSIILVTLYDYPVIQLLLITGLLLIPVIFL